MSRRLPRIAALLALDLAATPGCTRGFRADPIIVNPSARAASQDFSLRGTGFVTTVGVNENGAWGPRIDVGRSAGGRTFRGTASGRAVELVVTTDTVRGDWGDDPLNLDVTVREQHDFEAKGEIAGVPSAFSLTPEQVQGTIGPCSYDLHRSGVAYIGTRSCHGNTQEITMCLPASMWNWPSTNTAALLSLLLPEV